MDALPDPDYDDYFSAVFRLGSDRVMDDKLPLLLFESSRGCWWGQKHHCTFCGLNNNGMAFRRKSPERVLEEVARLSSRYAILNFEAVDNIMDTRYVKHVWSKLAEERYDYRFFYEVKAKLSRAQLRTMSAGGITAIQPGIESMSTHILKLMRKGTTMLDNVRILKWGRYYSMRVGWNLLLGFPGETAEDYERQQALIPLLRHLQPPSGVGPVWLERFSPYFFDPSFPVHDVRPERAYGFIYPGELVDLDKIAYFFDYQIDDVVIPPVELARRVDAWQKLWRGPATPTLVYQRAPDWLQIIDRRDPSTPGAAAFRGHEAAIYETCGDAERTAAQVRDALASSGEHDVTIDQVDDALARFCDLGLMIEEDGRHLSLALPVRRQ
jgi:ribosomal peptide maturation radical SAM protein 1